MPETNVSQLHEYQFVSAIALNPVLAKHFEGARQYLYYPESKSLFDAVVRTQASDPALLATAMSKNGFAAATPQFVEQRVLIIGKQWPVENLDPTVDYLKELWSRRESTAALDQIKGDLLVGKITPTQAAEQFAEIAAKVDEVHEDAILSDEQWVVYGPKMAEERRALLASNAMPRLPLALPTLHEQVPMELDTLVLVTGRTGGGKSSLMEMVAEYLADTGHTVFYVLTELTKAHAMWRSIARRTGISYASLRNGFWNNKCTEAVRPRKSGGRVIYFEAGGYSLQALIAKAEQANAHMVVDYWDMLNPAGIKGLQGMRNLSMSKTDVIGYGLTDAKAYAQHKKRLVFVVQQYGKADNGPMDSARFEHRCNLWLKIELQVAEKHVERKHPVLNRDGTVRTIPIWPGRIDPLGGIMVAKDTFGGNQGLMVPVFMDGERYRFIELETVPVDQATDKDLVIGWD